MTTITLSPVFGFGTFLDASGNPLSGGKVYAYEAGSFSTLKNTYNNDTGTPVLNANPIVLDSGGRLPVSVWLETSQTYNLVVTKSDGTTVIEAVDYVTGAPSTAYLTSYVDDAVSAYLPLTGGSITGNLSVSGTTTAATLTATTLTATTSTLGTATATTLTATLNANSQVISNVATPVASTDAVNKAYADAAGSAPPGTIVMYGGTSAPTGWLLCDGSSVSRTTYAALYGVLGTTFGFSDASHFNLPDMRGQFARGYDAGAGVDSGRVFGSTQADALQNITGSFAIDGDLGGTLTGAFATGTSGSVGLQQNFSPSYAATFDASRVARTSTETRPTNVALTYIVKY